MIRLYAICDHPELPPPDGLEGYRQGALLAVGQQGGGPVADALTAMLEHERVAEELMEDRTVLPLRFGTELADADAVTAVLGERQEEFLDSLDRVRGRVELSVRAIAPEEAPAAPAVSGREYLEARIRDERAATALHEPLAAVAVDAARRAAGTPGERLRAAYLVDRESVPAFRAAVDELQREHPGTAILCTGPWPPYSFTATGRGA